MIDNLRRVLFDMGYTAGLLHDDTRLRADLGMDSAALSRLDAELWERFGTKASGDAETDYTLSAYAKAAVLGKPRRLNEEDYRQRGWWRPELLDDLVLNPRGVDGDRASLIGGGHVVTRQEADAAASVCAARLSQAGIRQGDAVLVQLTNEISFLILVWGLIRLGAPPVLASTALGAYELESVISQLNPVAMAVSARHGSGQLEIAERLRERHRCLRGLIVDGDVCHEHLNLQELIADGSERLDVRPRMPSETALFLLSSGTTGPPKPIPRTHEAFGYVVRSAAAVSGLTADSVYLAVMPVAHSFTFGHPGILGALAHGGKAVVGTTDDPASALALIEREGVTHCALAPTLARQWLAAADTHRYDVTSLEVMQVGGARLDEETADRISERFGCKVQQVYGMSEGLLAFTRLGDPASVVRSTQGRPISPGDEIQIVDDGGFPVRGGEIGELIVRGPSVIPGYYGDVATSAFTAEGFYKTGDLVCWHESGNLVVAGRIKDVINRGGEKIPADELDLLAQRHPDVCAAATVAMPHAVLGEAVCMYIVGGDKGAPTLLQMRRFLEEIGIAKFKLPQRVVAVPKLPMVGIGKVDKARLRREIVALLAQEQREEGRSW